MSRNGQGVLIMAGGTGGPLCGARSPCSSMSMTSSSNELTSTGSMSWRFQLTRGTHTVLPVRKQRRAAAVTSTSWASGMDSMTTEAWRKGSSPVRCEQAAAEASWRRPFSIAARASCIRLRTSDGRDKNVGGAGNLGQIFRPAMTNRYRRVRL